MLEEYASGQNKTDRFSTFFNDGRLVYGSGVYGCFYVYLEQLIGKSSEYDIRPFQILWEHKKIMLQRLNFIQNYISEISLDFVRPLDSIISEYSQIEQKVDHTRYLMLIYEKRNKIQLLKDVMNLLKEVETNEQVIISNLIDLLRKVVAAHFH